MFNNSWMTSRPRIPTPKRQTILCWPALWCVNTCVCFVRILFVFDAIFTNLESPPFFSSKVFPIASTCARYEPPRQVQRVLGRYCRTGIESSRLAVRNLGRGAIAEIPTRTEYTKVRNVKVLVVV